MSGFLVRRHGGGRSVRLDEHEARRVVAILDDVEAGDAGLAQAGARIFDRGGAKRVDGFRQHPHEHVDDVELVAGHGGRS